MAASGHTACTALALGLTLGLLLLATAPAQCTSPPHSLIVADAPPRFRFDGLGGLSGGGATSTFLMGYEPRAREDIMDWMFKPGFAASLNILKVEIGADDQTTDGTEASHMRTPTEVNCSRGYEWGIMKAAVKRNPSILLYGLPWGFAGWLGFGTTNPYHNVTATADYIVRWVECGRDAHGLNISVLGLWNEAWQAAGRPSSDPWEYALALRRRLDSSGLGHVRILAPDGDIGGIMPALASNASYKAATSLLGAHYPGMRGTTAAERGVGLPLWASEDYSTFSDATGAGCWARLLVQNAGWGYGATISWYLLGSFSRGMHYGGDGLLRAEWPTSGHWEVTPMAWTTMHWTLFMEPGWGILACPKYTSSVSNCALQGGGNYAVVASKTDVTVVVETFEHNASQCIRQDPPGQWAVADSQTVTITLPAVAGSPAARTMDVWRSCTGWRYPADDDSYMEKLPSLSVTRGKVTLEGVRKNCVFTISTILGRSKPKLPTSHSPRSAAFPLPYREDFDGRAVGGEAPYFGDQEGKWETVPAGGGRTGMASQQQLPLAPWPILEPQCNRHGQPISIIGDLFFENLRVTGDVLLEEAGVGAGLALRIRPPSGSSSSPADRNFRGNVPGLFLYIGDTPAVQRTDANNPNAGGVAPAPNVATPGWALCADTYCSELMANGSLLSGALVGAWHTLSLELTDGLATGSIDNVTIFARLPVAKAASQPTPAFAGVPPSGWAGLVATIGRSQVDNFELHGTSAGGAAAMPCGAGRTKPAAGSAVRSVPCDYPGALAGWSVDSENRVRIGSSAQGGQQLCIGASAVVVASDSGADAGCSAAGVRTWAPHPGACGGLTLDATQKDAHGCATACCGDPACILWQMEPSGKACWRGNPTTCEAAPLKPSSGVRPGAELPGGKGGRNATLISCDAAAALRWDQSTGQIRSRGGKCLTAVQRQRHDDRHAGMTVTTCAPAPSDAQQFQLSPTAGGALRPKGRQCIAAWPSDLLGYRDCCVALCAL